MSELVSDPRGTSAEIEKLDAEAAQARAKAALLNAKLAESNAAVRLALKEALLIDAKAGLASAQARYEPWKAFAAGVGTVVATVLATIGTLRLFGII